MHTLAAPAWDAGGAPRVHAEGEGEVCSAYAPRWFCSRKGSWAGSKLEGNPKGWPRVLRAQCKTQTKGARSGAAGH